jgi:hypothetical protein
VTISSNHYNFKPEIFVTGCHWLSLPYVIRPDERVSACYRTGGYTPSAIQSRKDEKSLHFNIFSLDASLQLNIKKTSQQLRNHESSHVTIHTTGNTRAALRRDTIFQESHAEEFSIQFLNVDVITVFGCLVLQIQILLHA